MSPKNADDPLQVFKDLKKKPADGKTLNFSLTLPSGGNKTPALELSTSNLSGPVEGTITRRGKQLILSAKSGRLPSGTLAAIQKGLKSAKVTGIELIEGGGADGASAAAAASAGAGAAGAAEAWTKADRPASGGKRGTGGIEIAGERGAGADPIYAKTPSVVRPSGAGAGRPAEEAEEFSRTPANVGGGIDVPTDGSAARATDEEGELARTPAHVGGGTDVPPDGGAGAGAAGAAWQAAQKPDRAAGAAGAAMGSRPKTPQQRAAELKAAWDKKVLPELRKVQLNDDHMRTMRTFLAALQSNPPDIPTAERLLKVFAAMAQASKSSDA